MTTDPAVARWRRLPKAELHVHLRGAIPPAVLAELMTRHAGDDLRGRVSAESLARYERYANIRPYLQPRAWAAAEVAPLFEFVDFDQFLATFGFTGRQPITSGTVFNSGTSSVSTRGARCSAPFNPASCMSVRQSNDTESVSTGSSALGSISSPPLTIRLPAPLIACEFAVPTDPPAPPAT